jgi:hypothetical protein
MPFQHTISLVAIFSCAKRVFKVLALKLASHFKKLKKTQQPTALFATNARIINRTSSKTFAASRLCVRKILEVRKFAQKINRPICHECTNYQSLFLQNLCGFAPLRE